MADAYASALVDDETSRVHAALERWPMALADWMRLQEVSASRTAIGAEPRWPWDVEPEATDEEKSLAERVMAERSAIRD